MSDPKAEAKGVETDPVLSDAEFAALDTDGDGVVHLHEEEMLGNYTPPAPDPLERKNRGGAPENKDAARAAASKPDDDEPENVTPRNGRRGR